MAPKRKKGKDEIVLTDIPGRKTDSPDIIEKHLLEFSNFIYDWDALKDQIAEWFGRHKYLVAQKKLQEKALPLGRKVEVKWTGYKAADRFSRYIMKIIVQLTNTEDIRVKGSDKVLKQGNIKIQLTSSIELDYEHDWDKSKFQKYLKHLYSNYIYKRTFLRHAIQLITESNSLYSIIKATAKKYS